MKGLIITLILLPTILWGQIYHRDVVAGGLTYTIDSFTTSGTWTKPAGVDYVYFYVIGGGSGGGGGRRGAASSNRGGGRGFSSYPRLVVFAATDLNSTETIVVSAGGSGGAGATVDNTDGSAGGAGGNSYVRSISWVQSTGPSSIGGSTPISVSNSSATGGINKEFAKVIASTITSTCNGTTSVANETYRPNSSTNTDTWRGSASAGGSITSTNVQNNSGGIAGFYNETGTLTGQVSTGVGEGLNGNSIADGYTIGNYIAQFLHWFNPADITSEMPRGGMGGGPGDLSGTIAGGNGASGRGYGAAGGSGGASTNGANGGNGAAGNPGIVIAINVFE